MANHNTLDNREDETGGDDRTPALVEKFVIRLPNGLRDHIRQKFLDRMSAANPDGAFKAGERNTELELSRRLENLPAEKKEALLELLG